MSFNSLTNKFFWINFIIIIIATIGLGVYDPLHIFHKSWITKNDRLHGNMRLQAAGIINNYNFDSVIIGTSMMKGTSAISASHKMGGKFVNVSSDGSSIFERKYIINYALQKKNIKNVILSFDTGLNANLKKDYHRFPINRFDFLYDDIWLNDVKAYWNYKFIGCLIRFSFTINCLGSERNVQRPLEWFNGVYKLNQEISGIENWVHSRNGRGKGVHSRVRRHITKPIKTEKKYEDKLRLTQEIIEGSLFSIIENHKSTKFHVVFPPYSRFLYALWKRKNPYKYQLYIQTLKYLVIAGNKYSNLTIYSFDNLKYLDDLDNYRDMRHYNTDINEVILDAISNNRNIISGENLIPFINKIDKLNGSYKLDEDLNYLLSNYSVR